jgi:hypothetical protein
MTPESQVGITIIVVALVLVGWDGCSGGSVSQSVIACILQDELAVRKLFITAGMLSSPLERHSGASVVINRTGVVTTTIVVLEEAVKEEKSVRESECHVRNLPRAILFVPANQIDGRRLLDLCLLHPDGCWNHEESSDTHRLEQQ